MKIRILPLLLVLALAGCASAPLPVPEGYNGPLAKVYDSSTSVSATKVQFFELAKIDGRRVETSADRTAAKNYGHGFVMQPIVASRHVPAKQCVMSLEGVTYVAADILAFGGGMYHVEGDVTMKLETDKEYYVKGELSKDYSAVWLEDSAGHIVSIKIENGQKPVAAQ